MTILIPVGGVVSPTMLMSEWPFMLFSILFLVSIHQIEHSAKKSFWIILGILALTLAILTRYQGLTLLAATLLYALWKNVKKQPSFSLFLVGLTSGVLFILFWLAPLFVLGYRFFDSGYYKDTSFIHIPSFATGLSTLSDLFFRFVTVDTLLQFSFLANALGVCIASCMLTGLWRLVKAKQFYCVDFCTVFSVVALSFHDDDKARYVLPFAPFLLYYFFLGIQFCAEKCAMKRMLPYLLGVWVIYLFGVRAVLLFYGNGKDYNGNCILASPSPVQYYKGVWKELYVMCDSIKGKKPGALAIQSPYLKYIVHFSDRHVVNIDSAQSAPYVLVTDPLTPSFEEQYKLQPLMRGQYATLYEHRE